MRSNESFNKSKCERSDKGLSETTLALLGGHCNLILQSMHSLADRRYRILTEITPDNLIFGWV